MREETNFRAGRNIVSVKKNEKLLLG